MSAELTPDERSAVMRAARDCGPCQQGTWDVEGCRCAEGLAQAVGQILADRLAAQKDAIAEAIEKHVENGNGPLAGQSWLHPHRATFARIVREFGEA